MATRRGDNAQVRDHELDVRGQRVDGVLRVTDIPTTGHGRRYLVERELTTNAELQALTADYLDQAARWNAIPVVPAWLDTREA